MTSKEHIAEAERLLKQAVRGNYGQDSDFLAAAALEAIGHALIALAVEFGVPHSALPAGGDDNGAPAGTPGPQ